MMKRKPVAAASSTKKRKASSSKPEQHIIIREKTYVPVSLIDKDRVKDAYTKSFYEERGCKMCEYRPDRHSSMCDVCDAYRGTTKLYSRKVISGIEYIGLPLGDKRNFERKTGLLFDELKIYDRRVLAPFAYPVKFTLDLYDNQVKAVGQFMKKKYGLLEAPPRTGKTAMALAIAILLGQRMVLLASQHEFLSQFLDHIHGNEKEGIPKCTNLPELERKYKRKLYGFPKTDEDFEDFQIMVMTYQQFLSEEKGEGRLKRLLPHIGTLAVDEVHKANAEHFATVVGKFPCKFKFGVTATVERKDKRDIIIRNILGPIVARSTRESLIPTVYVHETGFVPKARYASGPRSWVFAMQALSKDKKRNAFIVKMIMKDLKNGHNIVIPVQFKLHVFELQRLINQAFGRKICETFVGGGGEANKNKRKDILALAKENKIRVIVGIRSLLQLGLNVPSWSCIYTIIPISNEPNYKQETSRIRTPMPGKRPPIVRLFVEENLGQSFGCARNCVNHMRGFKYKFATTDEQKSLVRHLLESGRKTRTSNDVEDEQFKAVRTMGRGKQASRGASAGGLFKRL